MADSLSTRFRAWTGRPEAGVWSAPGRVNLLGEHTDYNDGLVLPFAIGLRTRVALGRRPDRRVRVLSLQQDAAVEADLDELHLASGWGAYVLGTLWALFSAGAPPRGLDLVVDGGVPPGAGLSSSAALECAVALAVRDLLDVPLDALTLAEAGRRAENEVVGAPVGLMDQAVSLLAEAGSALLLDCRSLDWSRVPLDPAAAGLRLLVTDSGVTHALADGSYARRREECAAAAEALGVPSLRELDATDVAADAGRLDPVLLRRARHVVSENERVLMAVQALGADDWPALGRLLTASHASLRDDFEVSVPEVDGIVEAALAAGALGARMTGGGFGGNALALVPEAAVDTAAAAIRRHADRNGWPAPHSFVVRPEGGARRDA